MPVPASWAANAYFNAKANRMIQIERILFATDFSNCAREAQRFACSLAGQFSAELHLLHVLQDVLVMLPEPGSTAGLPQNYMLELKQSAERALEGLLPAEWSQGRRVIHVTRLGSPYGEIVRYAGEKDIDLIVVGTHGRSGMTHFLLGSVAEKVVRHAPCPVLTVRSTGGAGAS